MYFKMCKGGKHDLIEIHRSLYDVIGEAYASVKWCRNCGAVVVDIKFDGRTNAGAIMKMRFPAILKLLAR